MSTREQQKREHFEKYDTLAKQLGWDAIAALVPFSTGRVRAALDAGDEHLNTLPLAAWDKAARREYGYKTCSHCNHRERETPPVHGCDGTMRALFRAQGLGHSLSDGVCLLKHVARVGASRDQT